MDFNSEMDERYRKSVLTTICEEEQIVHGGNERSLIVGNAVYKSGTAIAPSQTWHEIRRRGLYRAEAAVTFVAAESGRVTVRMLLDGKELPASHTSIYANAGYTYTITPCVPAFDRSMGPSATPLLELTISTDGAGSVLRAMLSTTKLA